MNDKENKDKNSEGISKEETPSLKRSGTRSSRLKETLIQRARSGTGSKNDLSKVRKNTGTHEEFKRPLQRSRTVGAQLRERLPTLTKSIPEVDKPTAKKQRTETSILKKTKKEKVNKKLWHTLNGALDERSLEAFKAKVTEVKKKLDKKIAPWTDERQKQATVAQKMKQLVNYATSEGRTILTNASVRTIDPDVLTILVKELGADLNQAPPKGTTPLITAILVGNTDEARYLVELGADVNKIVVNEFGEIESPLIAAVSAARPDMDIIDTLLENNADLSITDQEGRTALDHAKDSREEEVVKKLIAHEAKINAAAKANETKDREKAHVRFQEQSELTPKKPVPSRESRAEISDTEDSSVESVASGLEDSEVESTELAENRSKQKEEREAAEKDFLEAKYQASARIVHYKVGGKVSNTLRNDMSRCEDLLIDLKSWREGRTLSPEHEKRFSAMVGNLERHIGECKDMLKRRERTDPMLDEVSKLLAELKQNKVSSLGFESRLEAIRRGVNDKPETYMAFLRGFRNELIAQLTPIRTENERIEIEREMKEHRSEDAASEKDREDRKQSEEAERETEKLGAYIEEAEKLKEKEREEQERKERLEIQGVMEERYAEDAGVQKEQEAKGQEAVERLETERLDVYVDAIEKMKSKMHSFDQAARKVLGTTLTGKSVEEINGVKKAAAKLVKEIKEWKEQLPASDFTAKMDKQCEVMMKNLTTSQKIADEGMAQISVAGMNRYQLALTKVVSLASSVNHVMIKEKKIDLRENIDEIKKLPEYKNWVSEKKSNVQSNNEQDKAFSAIEKLDALLKKAEDADNSNKPRVWKSYCRSEVRAQLVKMGKDPLKTALDNLKSAPEMRAAVKKP